MGTVTMGAMEPLNFQIRVLVLHFWANFILPVNLHALWNVDNCPLKEVLNQSIENQNSVFVNITT